ncbi:MAG: hypothetical protein WDN49_24520 [Acetobacteraceae bacterium]
MVVLQQCDDDPGDDAGGGDGAAADEDQADPGLALLFAPLFDPFVEQPLTCSSVGPSDAASGEASRKFKMLPMIADLVNHRNPRLRAAARGCVSLRSLR